MTQTSIGFQCISATQALALLRDEASLALFDVRDLASYRKGHVDGAAQLAEDRFPFWMRRLDKAVPVVIYCYHGNASKVFAQMFADFRFARVYSVDGGYEALAAAQATVAPA